MTVGIDASRANVSRKTGTEWYSTHLIERMIRRHPEVRFWLYSRTPLHPPLDRLLGNRVENRVLRWPLSVLWSQLRLSLEMLWRRPDVLFVPAHTIPLIHPRRTVTTCHDAGFERHPELYGQTPIGPTGGWRRTLLTALVRLVTLGRYGNSELDYHRFSMRLALRTAAQVITISEFSRREFMRLYDVPPGKLTVIPQGYAPPPAAETARADSSVRDRYGLRRPYVLWVGRLERKKNIQGAIAAYGSLQSSLEDPPDLVLVGKPGFGFEAVQGAIAALPTPEQAHHLSWVPNRDLEALWRGARAFIFPSFYEGFGLPLLDAFRHGVPVVASNAGSIPEVAGDAALLVDPGDQTGLADALRRILTDERLRERLIARGRARLKVYPTWDEVAERTFRILERAAA